MDDQSLLHRSPGSLVPHEHPEAAGEALNSRSQENAFEEFRLRKADNTLRRHRADLALFEQFLLATGLRRPARDEQDADPGALRPGDLYERAEAWRNITWGIVDHFVKWMLTEGYAVGSINVRLATVKTYAGLAASAGVLPQQEMMLIKAIKGYAHRESRRIDQKRARAGLDTRRKEREKDGRIIPSTKKAAATPISDAQVEQLKHRMPDDTPTVRRDNLLMCLLLDHGLRVGEVVLLDASWVDLERDVMRVERPKVDLVQYHEISPDTRQAILRLFESGDIPRRGPLVRRMKRNGKPGEKALSESGANERVAILGRLVGLESLSPHDCRHYWATDLARRGFDPYQIMEAGGWSSLQTPLRYVKRAEIANRGMADRSSGGRAYRAETDGVVEWRPSSPDEDGEGKPGGEPGGDLDELR